MTNKISSSVSPKLDTSEQRQLYGAWLWLAKGGYVILFLYVLYSQTIGMYNYFGFTQKFLSVVSDIYVTKTDNNQFEYSSSSSEDYAKNYLSGIEHGDLILSIDGVTLLPNTTEENANALLKGAIGESVTLTVQKSNGDIKEYTVVRLKALVDVLSKFSLTPYIFFWSLYLIVVILLFSTTLVSAFIFRVRTTDWMVILVASAMLLLPYTLNEFFSFYTTMMAPNASGLGALTLLGFTIGSVLLLITMYVFPDGEFHPAWAKWVLVPIFLFTPRLAFYATGSFLVITVSFLMWISLLVGTIYKHKKTSSLIEKRQIKWAMIGIVGAIIALFASIWENNYGWGKNLPLIWIFLLTGAAVAQVYKYKKISTVIERQQSKWAMIGILGIIITLSVSEYQSISSPDFWGYGREITTIWEFVFFSLRNFIFMSILLLFSSITFAISIYRFRLWDADIYINRAFIYGLVTAILAIIWTITIALLQFLLHQFTDEQSPLLAAVLSSIQVAALFTPVRTRVEKWVNDRFYKDRINFTEAIVELQPEKWQFVSSKDMLELLVTKAPYLIKSTSSAIYLSDGREFNLLSTYGVEKKEAHRIEINPKNLELLKKGKVVKIPNEKPFALLVPLTVPRGHVNDLIGILALGSREEDRGYSRDHISDLTGLGKSAGVAIHFLQLNEKKMPHNISNQNPII